jgi:geranylgeranyl reductase family protein
MSTNDRVDALVIGAGPAGSAAAVDLAKGGARVALVDRYDFPRDKVCGDALIPDALKALERLSLRRTVLANARVFDAIRVYAPNENFVVIPGECACVPRAILDNIIRSEAVRQGARFRPGLTLKAAVLNDGVVQGATFVAANGRPVTIRADVTLLATGAAAEPLKLFNVCQRIAPSATAARVYFKSDDSFARAFDYLCISYDDTICPGYGWIFPGPEGVFNVGVGYYYDAKTRPPVTNIRVLLQRFLTAFPPAIELVKRSQQLTSLKGAPLRTALTGATLGVPGLLVIGEAAGLTYSFSGEGIGKAMESGVIAADVVLQLSSRAHGSVAELARHYSTRIRDSFTARFRAYKIAQDWLSSPTVANCLAWRANRSAFVKEQLEGMLQETVDPRQLFSPAGAIRSLVS